MESGAGRIEGQPHLIMSRGANQKHVYQGKILACNPNHPLLVRAVADCMQTTQRQLKGRYLKFCEFLWEEIKRDLQQEPSTGWNFCPSLGPIYLLEEKLVREGKKPKQTAVTASGKEVPVDGHFMCIASSF